MDIVSKHLLSRIPVEGRGGHIGCVAAYYSVKLSKGVFPLTALRPYQARLLVPAINYAVYFFSTGAAPVVRGGVKRVFPWVICQPSYCAINLARKGLCTLVDRDFLWL